MADGIIVPGKQNPNVHAINSAPISTAKKPAAPQTIQMVKAKKVAATDFKKMTGAEFREMRDNEKWADYLKERASFNLVKDSKSGKIEYVEAKKVLGMTVTPQHYEYHADKKETLGDVKARYNLADGVLRSQAQEYGGDRDKHPAPPVVYINETDMEAALGKKLFHQKIED